MPENELVQPVINHASKIAELEEKQSQQEERLFQEIAKLRDNLYQAIAESTREPEARIAALEDQIGDLLAQAEKAPVATVNPIVQEPVAEPAFRIVRRNGRKIKRPA